MKRVATIILNHDSSKQTDVLVEHLLKYDGDHTDIYVLEVKGNADHFSKYRTWYIRTIQVDTDIMGYANEMNYGLYKLLHEGKYDSYDAYWLLTSDLIFQETSTLKELLAIIDSNKWIGILSPCNKKWGEKYLLKEKDVKCVWYVENNAYLLRREFLQEICDMDVPNYKNFLYDGNNIGGYMVWEELIAKAYANNWAVAITNKVWFDTYRESYILASCLTRNSFEDNNMKHYFDEGLKWLRRKYGFPNHWVMLQYVRHFYKSFFEYNPEYITYMITD